MKRRMLGALVLMLLTMTLYAQILPEWSQIVPGIWAHLDADEFVPAGMMDWLSYAGAVHIHNQQKLLTALKEIRTQNPEQFDSIFRSHGLAIDTR